jgi:xanthine dehydrogenase accessory factor
MTSALGDLKAFLAAGPVALVEVAGTKGSTPREQGAFMLVSRDAIHGTIGGGQLEYVAIDKARQLLRQFCPLEGEMAAERPQGVGKGSGTRRKEASSLVGATLSGGLVATFPARGREARLDVPLGPEIGQCCGGRVEVLIRLVDQKLADRLIILAEAEEARLPHLYIFGGGHVGKALAAAAALLPVRTAVVETRAEEVESLPVGVDARLTPVPEEVVRAAPAGSAFVVLTHDHALDFLIAAEALRRKDAAYVGMIGSKTKKATFRSWFFKTAGGSKAEFARLVSPIGGETVKDKRPAVIAALAVAEIMTALAHYQGLRQNSASRPTGVSAG